MADLKRSPPDMSTVLVVDDEEMLGRVIKRFLQNDYVVVTVTSAARGLEKLEELDDVGCILCDLMMPEMTGMEFYRELQSRFPEYATRVAFLSGGTFTPDAKSFISDGDHSLIEKPFRPERLREVVATLSA